MDQVENRKHPIVPGPKDPAAEANVLAAIFGGGRDAYYEVSDLLTPRSFTDPVNQAFYRTCSHAYEHGNFEQIDASVIMSTANSIGTDWMYNGNEDMLHVQSLQTMHVKGENALYFAARVKKLEVARAMMVSLGGAIESLGGVKGDESLEHIISLAESPLFNLLNNIEDEDEYEPKLLGDDIQAYIDHLESSEGNVGISSGFPLYDQAIGGGFRRKTVSLIGARMKTGKSFIALLIAYHVAKVLNIPVLYLDTEMTDFDQKARLLPRICYDNKCAVTINELESGNYAHNVRQKRAVDAAARELASIPLHYKNVSAKSFDEVLSIARRWVHKHVGYEEDGTTKDCLIIYDYMKVMSADGLNKNVQEYQLLGFMITHLHNFAVAFDVPIVNFTQLNRAGIEGESSGVIMGSDRIGQLVTNFSIFKSKSEVEMAESGEYGNKKMIPVMTRHGEGLPEGEYINMNFQGKYGVLEETCLRSEMVIANETTSE